VTVREQVSIWTDGACLGNPGPGGYGVVLVSGPHRRELSGGFRRTTNNRMELLGAIVALQALKRPCVVALHSDSRYVVSAMQKEWPQGWRRKGWRLRGNEPAKNVDLWEQMLAAVGEHEVSWHWVKGHAGDVENERCDRLAMAAAERKDLPVDSGYEASSGGGPDGPRPNPTGC
jgi:ribonuclease HI